MPIAVNERETISSNGHTTSNMDANHHDHHQTPPLPTIPSETNVDVLIVGAGPIGLLCAYQLVKFSKGKTRVIVIGESSRVAERSHHPFHPHSSSTDHSDATRVVLIRRQGR